MKIYLVQPSYKEANGSTGNGNFEIHSLARRMISDKIEINRIYVNEQQASFKTGSILSKMLMIPIVKDSRFVEVENKVILGNFNGLDLDNLENINLFIEEIIENNKDVLITIGEGVHRVVISKLTGIPLAETRHFFFQNAGFSVLYYDDDTKKWRINSINDVNHLRIP